MKKFIYTILVFCIFPFLLFSQAGKYDVRFHKDNYDCQNKILYVDIEVKALNPGTAFNMSEQNFRFSYNRDVVDPIETNSVTIVQELEISDIVMVDGTTSFYSPHNLNGSLDTILSYNVVLAGGDGFPIDDARWYEVGRMAFKIKPNATGCLELIWHTHAPEDFPPTFIGEKFTGILYEVEEGSYDQLLECDLDCTSLPVELVSFEGKNVDNKYIDLTWKTETESNNSHFEIQRKMGPDRWETLGKTNGNGTTTVPHNYLFPDENPIEGINYYRLKQVDFDNSSNYSEVIAVNFGERFEDALTVHPNPVLDELQIVFSNYEYEIQQVEVFDTAGKLMFAPTSLENSNTGLINVSALASGVYTLRVTIDDGIAVRKFVKY